jgi:hypothetical protein
MVLGGTLLRSDEATSWKFNRKACEKLGIHGVNIAAISEKEAATGSPLSAGLRLAASWPGGLLSRAVGIYSGNLRNLDRLSCCCSLYRASAGSR